MNTCEIHFEYYFTSYLCVSRVCVKKFIAGSYRISLGKPDTTVCKLSVYPLQELKFQGLHQVIIKCVAGYRTPSLKTRQAIWSKLPSSFTLVLCIFLAATNREFCPIFNYFLSCEPRKRAIAVYNPLK